MSKGTFDQWLDALKHDDVFDYFGEDDVMHRVLKTLYMAEQICLLVFSEIRQESVIVVFQALNSHQPMGVRQDQ